MSVPLNYFTQAAGAASKPVLMLDWIFTGICIGVCVIIAALIAAALLRRRDVDVRPESALRWVCIGTGISTAVLFGMTVYMLVVYHQILDMPQVPALQITVTGYEWWWQADYDGFTTANEIHIPTGVPVMLDLKSADVIHNFWVPQLAGKTQMIPGINNHQWIEADTPGNYRGQCTQFCGAQHAHMAFEVVAQSPDDFTAWQAHQKAIATAGGAGEKVFINNCAGCHAVRGTAAKGAYGPDLTHLQSRRQIAAGLMDNTPENLASWISHAQELKPGARMPDIPLSPQELKHLLAYLEELK
jgi:cytochrome c oxidase subunit 2